MTSIFFGHGNPMHAIADNSFTQAWSAIGARIGKPKGVVCVSAHWETDGTLVTAMERPRTIHDFYGFPQPLFDVEYDAPGDPKLAREIIDELGEDLIKPDTEWGLDHGTWSVLRHVFPDADVPILQVSLDRRKSAAEHFEFARRLRFLRERDILFVGSGNIVHNLRQVDFRSPTGAGWALTANEKLKALVTQFDTGQLVEYRSLGEEVRLAIPTPEHYLPLLYVLAMRAEGERAEIFNDVVELGSISMTSFELKS